MDYKSEQRILGEAEAGARRLRTVTPSDTVDLTDGPCAALYVGTEGDLSVIAENDSAAVTLKSVSGWVLVAAKRVMATGTTASDIVAKYI